MLLYLPSLIHLRGHGKSDMSPEQEAYVSDLYEHFADPSFTQDQLLCFGREILRLTDEEIVNDNSTIDGKPS